jgi:hypothetical protein
LTDPNQDEAFTAVADLYGALNDESKQRDWILKRAQSEQISEQRRASAYRRLADLDAACARRAATADRAEADRCAARGLDSVAKAIALNGESEGALTQKAQLLRERAKLAQSQGSSEQPRAYEGQAAASEKRIAELRDEERNKSQSLRTY